MNTVTYILQLVTSAQVLARLGDMACNHIARHGTSSSPNAQRTACWVARSALGLYDGLRVSTVADILGAEPQTEQAQNLQDILLLGIDMSIVRHDATGKYSKWETVENILDATTIGMIYCGKNLVRDRDRLDCIKD